MIGFKRKEAICSLDKKKKKKKRKKLPSKKKKKKKKKHPGSELIWTPALLSPDSTFCPK